MSDPTWFSDAALDRSRWGELVEPFLQRIALARDRDRFPHALLLVGPRELGRELAAVEAAVMLACAGAADPWSVSPCAERVRGGTHPDVRAVLPEGKASKIKIEQIRAIADEASSRPYEANAGSGSSTEWSPRVLFLRRPTRFSKTLEEPPKHVRLLLLAENPGAVLPTIRSRCQQLSLPGAAVVAGGDLAEGVPPELAASVLAGVKIEGRAGRGAERSRGRDLRRTRATCCGCRTSSATRSTPSKLVAAVATEMATERPDAERSEDFIRLAADLLATDRRRRALNLSSDRQLVSCLLRWYQEVRGEESRSEE